MKKPLKIILTAVAAIAVVSEYNRYIEKKAAALAAKLDCSKNRKYHWRFGEINYTVKGSGAPLLLIHGINIVSGAAEFERLDALSKSFKVYTLDLLGFGFSEKPNITYSSYMYASLIADFIREVIGTSANVIASGQSAVFAAAATYIDKGLIKKLVLVNPECEDFNCGVSLSEKLMGFALDVPVVGTFVFNMMFSKPMLRAWVKADTSLDKPSSAEMVNNLYCAWHSGLCKKSVISSMLSGLFSSGENLTDDLTVPALLIGSSGRFPHIEKPEEFCRSCIKFLKN